MKAAMPPTGAGRHCPPAARSRAAPWSAADPMRRIVISAHERREPAVREERWAPPTEPESQADHHVGRIVGVRWALFVEPLEARSLGHGLATGVQVPVEGETAEVARLIERWRNAEVEVEHVGASRRDLVRGPRAGRVRIDQSGSKQRLSGRDQLLL